MTHLRWWMGGLILAALPVGAFAQADRRDAIVIYKDGYFIKGKVKEQRGTVIWDHATGRPFPIPSGEFFIDDDVRDILFSPTNVQKVIQLKPEEVLQPMEVKRLNFNNARLQVGPTWTFDTPSKWSDRGVRTVGARTDKGTRIEMTQRIHTFSSHWIHVVTTEYQLPMRFFAQELGPEAIRPILLTSFNELPGWKDLKEWQKFMQIARFQQEAGWFDEAEKELVSIINAFPKDKKPAQDQLEKLRKERAGRQVESIERAANVGQPLEAIELLEAFDRLGADKIISPAHRLKVLDLKTKYEKIKTELDQAKTYLKQLPGLTKNPKLWTLRTEYIVEELNHDTVGRLKTFLEFAEQYDNNRKGQKKQQQSAEEVLALAITSWLQGPQAAEPDTKGALKLARARTFLLEYLKNDIEGQRVNLLTAFKEPKNENDLPIDVLVKLVGLLPPPAHDPMLVNNKPQAIKIDVPEGGGGSYHVQLPPDYHPQRSYPVLILLHSGRDSAADTLKRFAEEGAKNGFILAAPILTGKNMLKGKLPPVGPKQHALVCDTLRDLRRRLNIDSDRAFLFGFEDGGTLAFDVALGHPDLFAGAAPMCGALSPFTRRFYWPNAQYVPFYIIEGSRNADHPIHIRALFKDRWTREPYANIYVEYKGRSSEWFSEEVPKMLTWMSKKKRQSPLKEMGKARPGIGGLWEEFRSTRSTDNSFYWLRAEGVEIRCRWDPGAAQLPPAGFVPATFQGELKVENKLDKDGKARIVTKAYLRFSGLKEVTFWITPGMMDLTNPLALFVNGQPQGGLREVPVKLDTLLEELYMSGDRQRVFVAKIDIKK
ncbi:MAG: hypothetical protein EXR98_06330 [Gemmataceae bacterium]|nr:hypothetical protein [Gemmataceae bacterium]